MKPNSKTKALFQILIFMLSVPIFWACYSEEEITSSLDKEDDFIPINSDNPLDKVIFEFYEKYESKITYDFTEQFYNRRFLFQANSRIKIVLQTDENILLEGVKHLKKHFTAYYPQSFGKKYFPPYFLLADSIRLSGKELYADAKANFSFVALGKVRTGGIDKMNETDLKKSKDDLHTAFWNTYMSKTDKLNIDPKFYAVSNNYYENSNLTVASGCEIGSPLDVKKFGFWMDQTGKETPICGSGWLSVTAPTKSTDLRHFMEKILTTNETDMNAILENYPILEKKYNLLTTHLNEYFGFNIQTIGNGTPEFEDK